MRKGILTPSKYLILFIINFIFGIFLAEILGFDLLILGLSFLTLLAIFIFYPDKFVKIAGLSGLIIILGIFYYHWLGQRKDQLAVYKNKEVFLLGQVTAEPDIRADEIKLTIRTKKVDSQPAEGKVLVTVGRYPEYHFGDWLEIKGQLKEPQIYPEFNYKNYLARYQIYSVMYKPEIVTVDQPEAQFGQNIFSKIWFGLVKTLLTTKEKFVGTLNNILAEPAA
jgi:hypothetical protein